MLFREGYDPAYGARPLKRSIQLLIQDALARQILEGTVLPGEHVVVDADLSTVQMRFRREAAEPEIAESRAGR